MLYQRTIAKEITVVGIGIHSGQKVTLVLKPAEANTGIIFRRSDVINAKILRASTANVGATDNNTTLGSGPNAIHTVEHLLSVLYGYGIDNILCEVDGPEVPIMDGSAASFVFIIKEAGITTLSKSKEFMVIKKTIEIKVGEKWARIEPAKSLIIDSTIIFPHPVIKTQRKLFNFSCENYINDISRARTFGLLKDVDLLKRKGLIKGGSLDNAVVLDDFHVLNLEGLRFKDEFVRHKILDTIGDISLLGHEIAGKITTHMSGHHLHNLLCKKLLTTKNSFEIVSAMDLEIETFEAFDLPQSVSAFH